MLSTKSRTFGICASVLISISLLLSACGGNASSGESESKTASSDGAAAPNTAGKTMADATGNQVIIPANPQRIIASYLEDPLITLGIKPVAQWAVANGTQVYLKDELNGVPTIPSDLPFEAVASFNPDLMFIGGTNSASGEKYTQYSKIVPTFLLGDDINNDWRKALLKIGEVLGKSKEAEKAISDYEAKAKEAKEKLQRANGQQSAAAIWVTAKAVYAVSENLSSGAVMYQDLGFKVPAVIKQISSNGTANWRPIAMEKLAELDADHIFLIHDKGVGDQLLEDPVWKSIPAVKSGHVYEFDRTRSWLYSGAIANRKMVEDVLRFILK